MIFFAHERRDLDDRCTRAVDTAQRIARGEPYDVVDIAAQLAGLSDRYGGPGVAYALRYWCDQLIDATPGARRGEHVQVAFVTADGDLEAEATDPAHQWAGDLVAARLADDQMQFFRLTESLPRRAGDRGEYVLRLVEMVAHALAAYAEPSPTLTGHYRPGLYASAC